MRAPRRGGELASPDAPAGQGGRDRSRRRAAAASWDALPPEVVSQVLCHLAGDVRSLCAVSCVARVWRVASAEPGLWARLRELPRSSARRLTDARLTALVARARGGLESLDVSGALRLTDRGLRAALRQPHALVSFRADELCKSLSGLGVAAALATRRGIMQSLRVRGVPCFDEYDMNITDYDEPEDALVGNVVSTLTDLQGLLAPGNLLDCNNICEVQIDDFERCLCMCVERDDACGRCRTTYCPAHQERDTLVDCQECGKRFCDTCLRPAGPAGPLCNGCWLDTASCRRHASRGIRASQPGTKRQGRDGSGRASM
jgi:hypothetical protein